jgi:hypothetical protein
MAGDAKLSSGGLLTCVFGPNSFLLSFLVWVFVISIVTLGSGRSVESANFNKEFSGCEITSVVVGCARAGVFLCLLLEKSWVGMNPARCN